MEPLFIGSLPRMMKRGRLLEAVNTDYKFSRLKHN